MASDLKIVFKILKLQVLLHRLLLTKLILASKWKRSFFPFQNKKWTETLWQMLPMTVTWLALGAVHLVVEDFVLCPFCCSFASSYFVPVYFPL